MSMTYAVSVDAYDDIAIIFGSLQLSPWQLFRYPTKTETHCQTQLTHSLYIRETVREIP